MLQSKRKYRKVQKEICLVLSGRGSQPQLKFGNHRSESTNFQ
jgi:hypothetical protein